MTVDERDIKHLETLITSNHTAVMNAISEMKVHCKDQENQCSKVFEWFEKKLHAQEEATAHNANEITKIKAIGSAIVFIWTSSLAFIGKFFGGGQ